MPELFEHARSRLERQFQDAKYDPDSGWDHAQLRAELARHRAACPEEPRILTRAWLFHLLCERGRIAVEPDDYFAGKLEHHNLLITLREEWRGAAEAREFKNDAPAVSGAWKALLDTSHTCPDWRNLLRLGFPGLRDRAAARSGAFYQAVAMVYAGVLILIRRLHAAVPNPALAALAERPPQTLHESLQLACLYDELQEMEGEAVRSMGRFDLLYNDFYENDLRAGRITRAQAAELLKYFWIKYYAKSRGKLFGKPFLFGPEVNALTRLSFDVFRELRVVDPKFHLRLAEHTPSDFVAQVMECIRGGGTGIVIVNDERLRGMLEQYGRAPVDVADYILIGCYEPAIMGREMNWSGGALLNLAKPVELALAAGDYADFDIFMAQYLGILDRQFTALADRARRFERLWPEVNPSPLLSGTMDACLASGRDVSAGGAQYNTLGCVCTGLANAVDSLAVIGQLVFTEKTCTLNQLRDALAADWAGCEPLRLAARNRVAKWGNNDPMVDGIAARITDFISRRVNREPNARGGKFNAALYGILVTAKQLGAHTGALPDGRRAGEPLTMNTGATPGMDRCGITALINSVTKVKLDNFPGGTVLDVMLHPSVVRGRKGLATMHAIIRAHFAQGGMAIQFNIFDVEILREARRCPEKYANLQVRVCGWNVRFADLAPDEQDIFITKAEAMS